MLEGISWCETALALTTLSLQLEGDSVQVRSLVYINHPTEEKAQSEFIHLLTFSSVFFCRGVYVSFMVGTRTVLTPFPTCNTAASLQRR